MSNEHAVALSKLRMTKLSDAQRSAIARKAAQVRWYGHTKKPRKKS